MLHYLLCRDEQPISHDGRKSAVGNRDDPSSRLLTSRLSSLECRIHPIRHGDEKLLATYNAFFSTSRLIVIEVSQAVIDRATTLRAHHGFKTPDAIHLAFAIEAKADVFLTGDASLARRPGLAVKVLR